MLAAPGSSSRRSVVFCSRSDSESRFDRSFLDPERSLRYAAFALATSSAGWGKRTLAEYA